jgi:hypothetical protein
VSDSAIRAIIAAFGIGITSVVLLTLFLPQLSQPQKIGSATHGLTDEIALGDQIVQMPHSFSAGEIKVDGIRVQAYWPTITLKVNVPQDGVLQLRIPIALLKQMEVGNNLEYCVGFPLEVFVDQQPAESELLERTDKEEILSIPLSGPRTIDIVGVSLLYDPPTCGNV